MIFGGGENKSSISLCSSVSSSTDSQSAFPFATADFSRIFDRFAHLNKCESGFLTKEELLRLPELAANPLSQRIVDVFMQDRLDFARFCMLMAVFARNASRETKLRFAFQIYDVDGDGLISQTDLYTIMTLMVGNKLDETQVSKLVIETMSDFDTDKDGSLSFLEFKRALFDCDIEEILSIEL